MGIVLGEFTPTHVHNEGNKYEVLDYPRLKVEGVWVSAVLYRNKENLLCVRSLDNFNARFSPI